MHSLLTHATELRTRVDHCDFDDLKDSLIKDKIVIGIRDGKTQERLLRESDLRLLFVQRSYPEIFFKVLETTACDVLKPKFKV